MIKNEITNRGVCYIGFKCPGIDCKFCYYKFEEKTWKDLRLVKADLIRQAKYYGLGVTDFTGGEPLSYPKEKMRDLVRKLYQVGHKKAIIETNGSIELPRDDYVEYIMD
ncbi:hypothetical protein LCGC14_2978080 [marine sediment metagenome]|uniref:Radical SAM core domain-containing protein n=1 Tax=marine sediment metagenome TaxID=412755 RepID=A0A0F8X8A4_9ZZZZ